MLCDTAPDLMERETRNQKLPKDSQKVTLPSFSQDAVYYVVARFYIAQQSRNGLYAGPVHHANKHLH